jgi:hypothetical protein
MTVDEIFVVVREKAADKTPPYLVSDDTLIVYYNKVMNELCTELPLLLDSTTVAICNITISVIGTSVYDIDSRIVKIRSAKIAGQTDTLYIWPVEIADKESPNWEDADNGTPTILIDNLDTGKITLSPPPDAIGTVKLRVQRLPLSQATETSITPEIPVKYHFYCIDGILAEVFNTQDSDIFDGKRADTHKSLWLGHIETIKKDLIRSRGRDEIVSLHQGFM